MLIALLDMPAGYSSTPISGFTGHIPGAKWQVGSRYIPPVRQPEQNSQSLSNSQPPPKISVQNPESGPTAQDHSYLEHMGAGQEGRSNDTRRYDQEPHRQQYDVTDRNTSDLERNRISFRDEYPRNEDLRHDQSQSSILRPGSSQMTMGYNTQGMPVRLREVDDERRFGTEHTHQLEDDRRFISDGRAMNSREQEPQYNTRQLDRSRSGQPSDFPQPDRSRPSQPADLPPASRSRSLPRRRVEKDPFEGLEGGYWSKGEVLRNKERREMANRGKAVNGGQFNDTVPQQHVSERRQWQERPGEINDIPAAGYSGHIQGLRQLGVGKSFNTAAKQAKKEYVERRRAMSGSREQFYSRNSSELDSTQETLNYPRAPY